MASKALLEQSPEASTAVQKPFRSRSEAIRSFVRSSQLQISPQFTRWRNTKEDQKTAIYSGRSAVLLHAWVHILPLMVVIVILTLNIRTYFIGEISTNGLTAIQFAAKMLEVLIQASIATMVLALIRLYAVGEESLPLGALLTPIQLSDVSRLWSLELWGGLTSKKTTISRRTVLCIILPFAIALTAVIGPSSAILMIPRPIQVYATSPLRIYMDKALNLCGLVDDIYPKTIGLANGTMRNENDFNTSYDSLYFDLTTAYQMNPQKQAWPITVTDSRGSRNFMWSNRNPAMIEYSFNHAQSIATIYAYTSCDGCSPYRNLACQQTGLQPYVLTDCHGDWRVNVTDPDNQYLDFGPDKEYLNRAIPYRWAMRNASQPDTQVLATLFIETGEEDSNLTLVISQPSTPTKNNSLLISWVVAPDDFSSPINTISCTVDAYWGIVGSITSNNGPLTNQLPTSVFDKPDTVLPLVKNKTLVSLNADWVKRAFASESFSFMKDASLATTNRLALAMSYASPDKGEWIHVSQDAWSEISPDELDMNASQWQTFLDYTSENNLRHKYNYVQTQFWKDNWTDISELNQFSTTEHALGYGYDTSSVTVKLAMAVLFLYLASVLVYFVITLRMGYVGTSWDSVAELVAIALNSQRPESLKNTSAGIQTLETFRQPVNIRVNKRDSLEIVFDANEQTEPYFQVQPNEKY